MATYTLDIALALGSGQAGLADLRAQLVNTVGDQVGAEVSSGFVGIGAGNYSWTYAGFTTGFRGGVKFYRAAAPSVVLAFVSINPQDEPGGGGSSSSSSSSGSGDAAVSAGTGEGLDSTIVAVAAGPASAEVDGQKVTAQPLPALIAADLYLAQKAAAQTKARGVRFTKLVPPGAG